eukprot:CAMPEP_0170353138 /NCGR_PEP_ID=MMETSP0116_2-20130129/77886_1 /TAXON_ID=400756 /ORGANISM="Durinskia baltica, Strain CSIRO CS-38" /LENGTH=346 /DNA_ID=CAMNT_0010607075 /DNA_START=75 /DNA_END=1115 /DNA_ORIENTATION=+
MGGGSRAKKAMHEGISVPLAECLFTFVVGQAMTLHFGGFGKWRAIWRAAPMSIFSMIGCLYAFGDFLELESLGTLSGPAYQVLSQSKLIVTALMLWGIKGTRQAGLQWVQLLLLMFSLACYMIIKDLMLQPHREHMGGDSSTSLLGVALTVLKVMVSCFCAVLADKYMKDCNSDPIYMQLVRFKIAWVITLLGISLFRGTTWQQMQLVRFKIAWVITLLGISLFRGSTWQQGMFHDWNQYTAFAAASFIIKGWSTLYLLAILDSMLKNIGEACTVLVTYFMVVFNPRTQDVYENETFIAVLIVFLAVVAYLASKDVVKKAEMYDKLKAAKAGDLHNMHKAARVGGA